MGQMRYVVTEIEGYAIVLPLRMKNSTGGVRPGIACHVIDTAYNHRVVFHARTEDIDGNMSHAERRRTVRERAATRCDLLNRLDEIAREAQGAVA